MPTRRPVPLLFVHHRKELGGAPTSLSYLIRELDRERFEPHVYCPEGPAADLFRSVGATVHTGPVAAFTHIWASVYRGRRWLLFLRELLLLPRHVACFARTLDSTRVDLVHLNDSPLLVAGWLARRRRLPIVWHLRSALPENNRDLRSRAIRRFIRSTASTSIAINDDVGASFGVGSIVIANAVDLDRFRPGDHQEAKAMLGVPVDRPLVAFFGFLYPSKGFREFILAAAALRDRGARASFIVVGGAVRSEAFFRRPLGRVLRLLDLARNYEREARDLVSVLGLGELVRFVQFTRETATLYRASDVVVAPSRGSELGRPVIEAAASGVPVVATGSRTGAGIILPGKTGVLVRDFSAESIAETLESLLSDPEQRDRLGRAARVHAEASFEPAANARRMEAIYRDLLAVPERTRILYVHHRPQLGGAPSSLAHLIANLDERFEAHVLCPPGPAADLFEQSGAIVHTGEVSIFAHAWDNPYGGLRWLLVAREVANLPGHVRTLERLMRKYRYPIVHLNDSPLLPAAWVARRHGARVIWHLRSALAGDGVDVRSRGIVTLMDRWGDAAIAIDRDVASRFRLTIPMTIVHNSVPVPASPLNGRAARAALQLPNERVLVGFAGFIRRQKGWPQLVEAADILVRAGLPVHFVIMGGGVRPPAYFRTARGRLFEAAQLITDEESAIRALVREKRLDDRFSFLPFTSETGEIYSALDIVAFPNQGIGLGRPVLEAAMYGKPVVASGSADGGGVLVAGKTGFLLHDPSPESIAAALRSVIEQPDLRERLGAAATTHARDRFDPQRNARAVEAVYDELLGAASAPQAPVRQAVA
jgi:glycosyltransferase involved in cell wall biosynthesis